PYSFALYDDGKAIQTAERWAYRDLTEAEKSDFGNPFDPSTRERLASYRDFDTVNNSATGILWELWALRRQAETAAEEAKVQMTALRAELQAVSERLAQEQSKVQQGQALLVEAQRYIEMVHSSVSFRIGRAISAPLRLGKRYGGGAVRGGKAAARQFN